MPDIDDKLARLAREANEAHAQAQDLFKRGTEHAMAAGKALLKAKAKLKHGAWGPWLAQNFEGSERSAQLYMRLTKHIRGLDDETRNAVAELSLREAAQTIATSTRIGFKVEEVKSKPLRITYAQTEPEPLVPQRPVARPAQDAEPTRSPVGQPCSSRRSETSSTLEVTPATPDGVATSHVEALLACMRSTKPGEFATRIADAAVCDAADLEELAAWLSDAAAEISKFGTSRQSVS